MKFPKNFALALDNISSVTYSFLILLISFKVSTTALSVTAFRTDVDALNVPFVHLFLAIELPAP